MSITQDPILYAVPAPTTSRGVSTKLGASADGKSISYGSGRSAIIRSIEPGGPTLSMGHASPVTVCKIISPYYAASGDASGAFKVWDTTGNYSIKMESKPISRINDIAFDGEGKRLVLVGEGRSAWGATFSLDTGSSIGEIAGHSKVINGVAMRPQRPFRAVTGSDDFSVVLMNGVPFKFTSQFRRHQRFVQSMDYSPDGALFLSAGSDGHVLLYDGLTGEEKGSLADAGEGAHSSGVYAASFSKDSKQIATSSADAKVKLWDIESGNVVKTWDFASSGDSLQQQQVGNVWAGSSVVSLSFSGSLNVLDPRTDKPVSTLYGHQNPVTAVVADPKSSTTFYSGDSSGRVIVTSSGESDLVANSHTGFVVDLVSDGKDSLHSTSFDDTVKRISEKVFESTTISTGSQPKGLAASSVDGALFLATANDVQVIVNGSKAFSAPLSATCIACTSDGSLVAVGTEQHTVLLFDSKDKASLKAIATIELRAPASAVAFSPDAAYIAIGLSTGKIPLYEVSTQKLLHARWADSTARIYSLVFNKFGTHVVAASLDESIRVYSIKSPSTVLAAKNAHRGGVNSVVWSGDNKIVSAGSDGSVKSWSVKIQ